MLELEITAEGRVSKVHALAGQEPLAATAVATARSWRFEPALRSGRRIRARIRVEVRFVSGTTPKAQHLLEPSPSQTATERRVPQPETSGEAPASAPLAPATARSAAALGPAAPRGVTVLGQKQAPVVRSFTRAEVRQLPGAFGDPLRAIEAMPGVVPIISGLPYFYVRGSPPGNVGYYLDGIRVPLLYHFGLGPSVINPGLVERIDLYPGGYPATYGRYIGGIVTTEMTPARYELHGEASVRLVDSGAMVEGPLGKSGSLLVGGRYSYTATLLSLAAPDASLAY